MSKTLQKDSVIYLCSSLALKCNIFGFSYFFMLLMSFCLITNFVLFHNDTRPNLNKTKTKET